MPGYGSKKVCSILSLILSSLVTAPLLYSQQAADASAIDIAAVVTAKSGPPISDLQQKDFALFDNNLPRPISSFHVEGGSQAPIHVIVVLDAVNVSFQSIAFSRGEVIKFLQAHGGQLTYPTQIDFLLDNGFQVQKGFSTNGNELSSSVEQFKVPLRDIHRSSQDEASERFNISINALRSLTQSEANLPGRKLILWVSPGWPLLSGPGVDLDSKEQQRLFSSIVEMSNLMRTAHVTLYNVNPYGAGENIVRAFYYENFLKGVSKPGQVSIGDLSLQVLASQSGGLALNSSNKIVSQLQQCVADGAAYYEVSFVPAPAEHPDEYHHIELKVNQAGYTVRTRDGYYAKP